MSVKSRGIRASAATPRCSQRTGLSTAQIAPNTSDRNGIPTQSHTYTTYGTGLFASSVPNTSAISTQPVSSSDSPARMPAEPPSVERPTATRGAPASRPSGRSRGSRQRKASPTNEASRASAAPMTSASNGRGRSARLPTPWAGTETQGAAGRYATSPAPGALTSADGDGEQRQRGVVQSPPRRRPASLPVSVMSGRHAGLERLLDLEPVRVELVVVVAGDDEGQGLADRQVDLGRRRRDVDPVTVMAMVRPGRLVEVVADGVELVADGVDGLALELDGVVGGALGSATRQSTPRARRPLPRRRQPW